MIMIVLFLGVVVAKVSLVLIIMTLAMFRVAAKHHMPIINLCALYNQNQN